MNQQFLLLSFKHLKRGVPASDPMKTSPWIMHQIMGLLSTEVWVCSGFSLPHWCRLPVEIPRGAGAHLEVPNSPGRAVWTLTVPSSAVLSHGQSEPTWPMLLPKTTTVSSSLSSGTTPWCRGWQAASPLSHTQTQAQAKNVHPRCKACPSAVTFPLYLSYPELLEIC